jgi:predicted transposase
VYKRQAFRQGEECGVPSVGNGRRKKFTHYLTFDKCVKICDTRGMKQMITAKLKLHTDKTQFQALRKSQLAYRDALNHVSQYAFEHGKMSSGRALQRACYDEIRLIYHLPAQMACNVPARSEPPTQRCGQKPVTMKHCAKRAPPRNAIRDWIRLPHMFPRP